MQILQIVLHSQVINITSCLFHSIIKLLVNMGKNKKKGPKTNVFKVAGAKSLKKTKAKAVNLGLKNMKQKVVDLDKQFIEAKQKPTPSKNAKPKVKPPTKKPAKKVTKEEVASTVGQIDKMDI